MKYRNLILNLSQGFSRTAKREVWGLLLAASVVGAGVFMGSAVCSAKANGKPESKNERASTTTVHCDVENFGQVTDSYYRGAQPKEEQYSQLAALGVKTVIDLRDDPKSYAKGIAERAGLKYINFPLSDKDYPRADTAEKFLELVNNKENQPVYVHCAGGRHRTGIMTAVYRLTMQGWDINKAYEEMKQYDFYTRFGHDAMKKYIFDYSRGLGRQQPAVAAEIRLLSQADQSALTSMRARRVVDSQK